MSHEREAARTVPQRLRQAAALFEERNATYGGNYRQMGHAMAAMYPEGLTVRGPEEFLRLMLQVHRITKETRYARNFNRGGHLDSLEDMAVYAIMAAETDDETELVPEQTIRNTEDLPPGYLPVAAAPGTQVMFPTREMADVFVKERRPEADRKYLGSKRDGYFISGFQIASLTWCADRRLFLFEWSKVEDPPEAEKGDEWRSASR